MRAGKGPGPAPRPQPDNSHPSSPAALPEPHRLTPWLPRSRGAADAGPHAAMPGDAARSPRSLCRRKDSPALGLEPQPWASPPPAARRPRPPRGRHPEPPYLQAWAHPPSQTSFHSRAPCSPPDAHLGCRVHRTGLPPDSPVSALGNWLLSRKEFCEKECSGSGRNRREQTAAEAR